MKETVVIDMAEAKARLDEKHAARQALAEENAHLLSRARIGMRVKAKMAELPSYRELAQYLGVHPQRMSEYLAGSRPRDDVKAKLDELAKEGGP